MCAIDNIIEEEYEVSLSDLIAEALESSYLENYEYFMDNNNSRRSNYYTYKLAIKKLKKYSKANELSRFLVALGYASTIVDSAYEIVEQLNALKNNDDKDNGIKQTWIFAHPDNKKMTGPYPRFRIMLYDVHYRILLNHFSHKIDLITNTENKFVYGVKVLSDEKQQFFYEWHVSKGNEENCTNCWFTTAVSMPLDQGNSI